MGSGRNTPTKFYMKFLGETFEHQARNGPTTTASRSNGNQSTLEHTREHNNPENLIPRTVQNTAVSAVPLFHPNPSVAPILRTERPLPMTSAQVRFHPDLLDTTTPQEI